MKKRLLYYLALPVLIFGLTGNRVYASDTVSESTTDTASVTIKTEVVPTFISITVPTDYTIVLNDDGSNTVPEFTIKNDCKVLDVMIKEAKISEIGGSEWKLRESADIEENGFDNKVMYFKIGKRAIEKDTILGGTGTDDDPVTLTSTFDDFLIQRGSTDKLSFVVKRGIFTLPQAPTDAYKISVDYEFIV